MAILYFYEINKMVNYSEKGGFYTCMILQLLVEES